MDEFPRIFLVCFPMDICLLFSCTNLREKNARNGRTKMRNFFSDVPNLPFRQFVTLPSLSVISGLRNQGNCAGTIYSMTDS